MSAERERDSADKRVWGEVLPTKEKVLDEVEASAA